LPLSKGRPVWRRTTARKRYCLAEGRPMKRARRGRQLTRHRGGVRLFAAAGVLIDDLVAGELVVDVDACAGHAFAAVGGVEAQGGGADRGGAGEVAADVGDLRGDVVAQPYACARERGVDLGLRSCRAAGLTGAGGLEEDRGGGIDVEADGAVQC